MFVLSDFETEDDWIPAVQRIRATHPIVPIVLEEEALPETLLSTAGLFTYRDVETGVQATVEPRAWMQWLQEQKRHKREHCLTQLEAANTPALFMSQETFSVDHLMTFLDEQRL